MSATFKAVLMLEYAGMVVLYSLMYCEIIGGLRREPRAWDLWLIAGTMALAGCGVIILGLAFRDLVKI